LRAKHSEETRATQAVPRPMLLIMRIPRLSLFLPRGAGLIK
jgi:hypothetical protein